MDIYHALGNLGVLGQQRHRPIAAQVSRNGQQAQDAKKDEATSLYDLIFRDQTGNVKTEHKNEPDRWEDAYKDVHMRRRLRDQMHISPPSPHRHFAGMCMLL